MCQCESTGCADLVSRQSEAAPRGRFLRSLTVPTVRSNQFLPICKRAVCFQTHLMQLICVSRVRGFV